MTSTTSIKMKRIYFMVNTMLALVVLGAVPLASLAGGQNVGGVDQAGSTIKGIVKFGSKIRNTKKKIDMGADAICVSGHDHPVPKQLDRVFGKNGDDNTLQNVFVWVSKGVKGSFKGMHQATLDQKGCLYVPHVGGVVKKKPLEINNSDATPHNVHAYKGRKDTFNKSSPAGSTIKKTFNKTGIYTFKCDVHPWMSSYVHVVDHPFFAVTGADGSFEIKGLKPGNYEVSVWHEYRRYKPDNAVVKVTVGQGETKNIQFVYLSKSRKKK